MQSKNQKAESFPRAYSLGLGIAILGICGSFIEKERERG